MLLGKVGTATMRASAVDLFQPLAITNIAATDKKAKARKI